MVAAKPAIQKECGTECSDFIGFLDKCGQKRTDDAECKVDVEGICVSITSDELPDGGGGGGSIVHIADLSRSIAHRFLSEQC